MSDKKTDPTQDPKFQQVVQHFLKTPHKPHKPPSDKKQPKKKRSSGK